MKRVLAGIVLFVLAPISRTRNRIRCAPGMTAPPRRPYCLFVHHDDAVREWAYDRYSTVGRLDAGLDAAKANGWTLVSMRHDWNTIFPAE